MTFNEHMNGMVRCMGLHKACQVAERCMKSTDKSEWTGVPTGNIFFPTDKRGRGDSTKYLTSVHNYWVNGFNYLKKKVKESK